MTEWTMEEETLLQIYNRGSRISTISAIEEILGYLDDDPDMLRVALETIDKLDQMTDRDFLLTMVDVFPADEWEE